MRINKSIAQSSGLSRRAADQAIADGRVLINGQLAKPGNDATEQDEITLDGQVLNYTGPRQTIILHKPVGCVCSRTGQGSSTVYDLLPPEYQNLKIAGRLDKDSSGLLLLTSDGDLANQLTHPRYTKTKVYEIQLDKTLSPADQARVKQGVQLDDGLSALALKQLDDTGRQWQITMHEGRNRQIRRTFATLGYTVQALHRTQIGPYNLADLKAGQYKSI